MLSFYKSCYGNVSFHSDRAVCEYVFVYSQFLTKVSRKLKEKKIFLKKWYLILTGWKILTRKPQVIHQVINSR